MSSHHVIESLSITSGIHFRDVSLQFDPGLTCIIGGRGTGKSGVLHFIRFALGAKITEDFAEEHDEYVRETLGPGRADVGVRTRHDAPYAISRSYGAEPVVRNAKG